jgi:hypothetical protein
VSYLNVQYIAYEVPTGAGVPAGKCVLDALDLSSDLKNDQGFTGALNALPDDARARLARVLKIIQMARGSKTVEVDDKNTLKLFMAPEFYFRPEAGGPERSYSSGDLANLLAALDKVFKQDKLANWLAVLGTVVWNMKGSTVLEKATGSTDILKLGKLKDLCDQDIVYNTALVGIGGRGLYTFDKVNYSEADGVSAPYQGTIQKYKPSKFKKGQSLFDVTVPDDVEGKSLRKTLYEYFTRRGAPCFFGVEGVWSALEVCMDHDKGMLATHYESFVGTHPKQPPVLDFQLLSACGMIVDAKKLVIGKDRYVFRVDGANFQAAEHERLTPSEIQCVREVDDDGKAEEIDNTYQSPHQGWDKLNDHLEAQELAGDLAMDLSAVDGSYLPEGYKPGTNNVERKAAKLNEFWKQRMVIYPVLQLTHRIQP